MEPRTWSLTKVLKLIVCWLYSTAIATTPQLHHNLEGVHRHSGTPAEAKGVRGCVVSVACSPRLTSSTLWNAIQVLNICKVDNDTCRWTRKLQGSLGAWWDAPHRTPSFLGTNVQHTQGLPACLGWWEAHIGPACHNRVVVVVVGGTHRTHRQRQAVAHTGLGSHADARASRWFWWAAATLGCLPSTKPYYIQTKTASTIHTHTHTHTHTQGCDTRLLRYFLVL